MLRKNPFVMKRFFYFFMLIFSAPVIISSCAPDVDDSLAPTIVFAGGNPMYVKLHTHYKDSLVYFNDANGVARVWNDTSNYNPEHIGRYDVHYYAEDAAGNVGTATRAFVVRIEGFTLKGRWSGTKTQPLPGGTTVDFVDSLVNPLAGVVYLSRLIPGTHVKMELKGSMGDTLYIPSQVVAFTDTSQTSIKGSGKVTGDGKSFRVDYLLLTLHNAITDTTAGQLDFLVQGTSSKRAE